MRSRILASLCMGVLGFSAFLAARGDDAEVRVKFRLTDATSGKPVTGIVRLFAIDNDSIRPGDSKPKREKKPLKLASMFSRMHGMSDKEQSTRWYVVPPDGAETSLAPGDYLLEAVSGLETATYRKVIHIARATEVQVPLQYLFKPELSGLYAGNTHLHLSSITLDEAKDYILKIPAADRLQVLFLSYLERHEADKKYITNKFPIGDLPSLSTAGVLVNNGEEHRHNFKGFGEGYGHVMFLNIKKMIQPVSIGPGIMATGFDDPALRPGLDNALKQGATVIWCHNTFGYEDVPSALAGKLHAINFFDGSRRGTFAENYYRYLDVGIPMAISTGTDWFQYDFSRVYAQVDGKLTVPSWLDAVKKGRCQATNSTLLSLKVNGQPVGSTIRLDSPQTVTIEASALGRHDFQKLQLVHNGAVIHVVPSSAIGKQKDNYRAKLVHKVRLDEPGWFAVRIESDAKNEFDREVYAHTSPVYVDLGGKKRFDVEAARALLKQIEEGQAAIAAVGNFSSPEARWETLALYESAAKDLRQRVARK